MAAEPVIKTVVDIVTSLVLAGAAVMAVRQLTAWRTDGIWKRRIDLAEETLSLFYQAQDAVAVIRRPGSADDEGRSRTPNPDESAADKALFDSAFVVLERYHRHTELFARLDALHYRFKAVFGEAKAVPFTLLSGALGHLLNSARRQAQLVARHPRHEADRDPGGDEAFEVEWKKVEAIVRESADGDAIAPAVNAAVFAMEAICAAEMRTARDSGPSAIDWRLQATRIVSASGGTLRRWQRRIVDGLSAGKNRKQGKK